MQVSLSDLATPPHMHGFWTVQSAPNKSQMPSEFAHFGVTLPLKSAALHLSPADATVAPQWHGALAAEIYALQTDLG